MRCVSMGAVVVFALLLTAACSPAVESNAQSSRARIMEVLALQALAAEPTLAKAEPAICKYAVLAGSPFQATWTKLCTNLDTHPRRNCTREWLQCMNKEASAKVPSGGSFECDTRLSKCFDGS